MSFVAISSDGQKVAGDSLVSFGEGELGFWSFPVWQARSQYGGFPVAVSPDFRYLVHRLRRVLYLDGDVRMRSSFSWRCPSIQGGRAQRRLRYHIGILAIHPKHLHALRRQNSV